MTKMLEFQRFQNMHTMRAVKESMTLKLARREKNIRKDRFCEEIRKQDILDRLFSFERVEIMQKMG